MAHLSGCAVVVNDPTSSTLACGKNEIASVSEVAWEKLNPARGDKSPWAVALWGDRQADVAPGSPVAFVDGFRSPPHIHNVSYRGIVIDGLVHNDDPGAADMWMSTGSCWTQPKGEVHITDARGGGNLAYLRMAYLWGDPHEDQPNGALLRMKPGYGGEIDIALRSRY